MDCLVVLQMAPKNQPRVGNKRQKPSSSGTIDRPIPPPRTFDRSRFSSGKHFQRFTQFGKGTWHEKVFDIRPTGQYAYILEMITTRGWSKLLTPETRINPDIVKEFYANAMPLCETHEMVTQFTYTTMVRGTTIRFDRDTINTYLGEPLELPPSEDPTDPALCRYGQKERDNEWNHTRIEREILLPGKRYNRGRTNEVTTANFSDMTLEAAIIFQFLVHNVVPKSHVTTTPVSATPLLWHILRGGEVDVARVISEQLKHVALSGLIGKATKLSFPGLIMGLVKDQGVQIPEPRSEQIKGVVNDRYIHNHSQKIAGAVPHDLEPEPEQEPEPEVPQEDLPQHDIPQHPGAFDLSSISAMLAQQDQRQEQRARRQEQRDYLLMDQQAAVFRSNQGIYQHLYDARLDPHYPMLTPGQFMQSCMWPGDRPVYSGGGGVFGGPVDDLERTASVHGVDDLERTASVHGVDDMEDDADDANH